MNKILVLVFFSMLMSLDASAQFKLPDFNQVWSKTPFYKKTSPAISVDWSCSVGKNNAEDYLPQNANVVVKFDRFGRLSIKPNIFKTNSDPLRFFKNLIIPDSRSVAPVDYQSCVTDFYSNFSKAYETFKNHNCPNIKLSACDVKDPLKLLSKKLDRSKFFKKQTAKPVKDVEPEVETEASETIAETATLPKKMASPEDIEKVAADILSQAFQKKKFKPADFTKPFSVDGTSYNLSQFDRLVPAAFSASNLNPAETQIFLQNYLVSRSSYLSDDATFNNKFCQSQDEKCAEARETKKQVLANANTIFKSVYGDMGINLFNEAQACLQQNENDITGLKGILAQAPLIQDCKDLAPGESKVFVKAPKPPEYYMSGDYVLKRKPNGNYEASLSINFQATGDSKVSVDKMMENAKACMAKVSPYMKGKNGENLEIKILTQAESLALPVDQRPKTNTVKIGPKYATDSGNFNDSIDCPTMTHEFLHHLGLCDEYKEVRDSRAAAWSCRPVTKVQSIMNQQYDMFNDAVPQSKSCECKGSCRDVMNLGSDEMKRIYTARDGAELIPVGFRAEMIKVAGVSRYRCVYENTDTIDVKSVPKNASNTSMISESSNDFLIQTIKVNTQSPSWQKIYKVVKLRCVCEASDKKCQNIKKDYKAKASKSSHSENCPEGAFPAKDTTSPSNIINIVSTPPAKSLLQPNHFDKILAGSCPYKATSYQTCGSWAYKGDKDRTNGTCALPAQCLNDSYYLGSPQ